MKALMSIAALLITLAAGIAPVGALPSSREPLERALPPNGIGIETEEMQGMLVAVTMDKATIQNKEGLSSFVITERTDVRMGSREASAADLRTGMMVHVVYVRQLQRRLATVIIVDPPIAIGSR
jgi:hypothetical protein